MQTFLVTGIGSNFNGADHHMIRKETDFTAQDIAAATANINK